MDQIKKSFPDCLFEVSWEVCNKIGGIHTVLSTKSALVEGELKKNYITIGPDVWMDTEQNPEFSEDKSLFRPWKQKLSQEGLNVRIGRWNIPGNPVAFLVDFTPYISRKDEILTSMWKKFGVDSLTGNWDYIEAALFGYASGMVIESFVKFNLSLHNKVVAHFHEWMTGAGLLYIKERNLPVATVFTTHATVLGRCLAGNNLPLYSGLDNYVPDDKARELGVQARHSLEKQSAANADVFTTVSGITARECARFLGKEPDIITPNGFSEELVPSGGRLDEIRTASRARLLKVASAMCSEVMPDDSLVVGIGGRYEFKNKGIDVFLEALNRLNRDKNLQKKVLALVSVPGWVGDPREDLLQRLKSKEKFNTPLQCPLITHWLHDMTHDQVLDKLKYLDLNNRPSDHVKVIFVPCYLDGRDGIVNKAYYDIMPGLDLSVYPSYYEPWGYTPLESVAFHVPTITTDLAGFGLWVKSLRGQRGIIEDGVQVLHRSDYNYSEVADGVKDTISLFSSKTPDEVKAIRKRAGQVAEQALWKHFIQYYYEAYDIALRNAMKRLLG